MLVFPTIVVPEPPESSRSDLAYERISLAWTKTIGGLKNYSNTCSNNELSGSKLHKFKNGLVLRVLRNP